MRFRLLLTMAAVTALSLVVATPATAVTKAEVRSALLTADNLNNGWNRADLGSAKTGFSGCQGADFTSGALDAKAAREWKFRQQQSYLNQKIRSFTTSTAARKEFSRTVQAFTGCTDMTIQGEHFTVRKLTTGDFADQRAAFRFRGNVPAGTGLEPKAIVLVATRWGHHVSIITMSVGGGRLSAEDQLVLRNGAVRTAKAATVKVDDVLGR